MPGSVDATGTLLVEWLLSFFLRRIVADIT